MKEPPTILHRHRRAVMGVCIVAWAAACLLTHLPQHYLPRPQMDDRTLHGLAYFILASLLWLTLRAHAVAPMRRVLWTAGVTVCYGVLDELTQPLTGRSAELSDWAADVAAAAAAIVICEILAWIRRRPRTTPDRS